MRLEPAPMKGDPISALDAGTGCGTGMEKSGNGGASASDFKLGWGAGASEIWGIDVVGSGCNKGVVGSLVGLMGIRSVGTSGAFIGGRFPVFESLDSDPLERRPNSDFAFLIVCNGCK